MQYYVYVIFYVIIWIPTLQRNNVFASLPLNKGRQSIFKSFINIQYILYHNFYFTKNAYIIRCMYFFSIIFYRSTNLVPSASKSLPIFILTEIWTVNHLLIYVTYMLYILYNYLDSDTAKHAIMCLSLSKGRQCLAKTSRYQYPCKQKFKLLISC